jgi:hypothetical protein
MTHNLKVIGSNPIPATRITPLTHELAGFFWARFQRKSSCQHCVNKTPRSTDPQIVSSDGADGSVFDHAVAAKVIGRAGDRTLGSNLYRSASLPKAVCSPGAIRPSNSSDFSSGLRTPDRQSGHIILRRPFLSEALDSTHSVRFSRIEPFELLMNFIGKRFCRLCRTCENV